MNFIKAFSGSGILLTRHCFDSAQGLILVYWLHTPNGAVKLEISDEKVVFFIESSHLEDAKQYTAELGLTDVLFKAIKLKNFSQQAMVAVYCDSLSQFYRVRDQFQQHNIKCYEDDIRPDDRYLMERFITSELDFVSQEQQLNTANHYHICQQVKTKKHSQSALMPQLKILSLDIECELDGQLFSIALFSKDHSVVFMLGEPQENAPLYIQWLADEKQLLVTFLVWLSDQNPDILIGWNVVNFDFAVLQKRFDHHGIKFSIGRDESEPYWRTNKNQENQKFISIAGRVVLDGIDLLKAATYNFASFSLENVAQQLLGRGKSINTDEDKMAEIRYNFQHNKIALAKYNLLDCELVWDIFQHTQLLEFTLLRAKLTGLTLDKLGGSVAAFTNLYVPKLHRAGYIAPSLGDGESGLQSPGGYVMDSIPGLYNNVLVFDFKSLYPSIIRTFKIDPLGLIEGLKRPDEAIKGYDGAYFSREHHFLPKIIEQLWSARDKAKADKNAPLSQAIKIIMNSFYGVLGSTGCRFFDPRLSGSITKRSHDVLLTTKHWLEQQEFTVIYGDTDSIFVSLPPDWSAKKCIAQGNQLKNDINDFWQDYIQRHYQLTSYLELEFETHFHRFFMPTLRGSDVGTKKRYAGLVIENGVSHIVYKGLESVRSDWTQLAKTFQQQLYNKIFADEPVEQFVISFVRDTRLGVYDDLLVYHKRIRRKLIDYKKNIPPHVKAARLADEQNKKRGKPLQYQHKSTIDYVMTQNGPQVPQYQTAKLDYDFYIERQLKAVADAILPCIGLSFEQLIAAQISLFE